MVKKMIGLVLYALMWGREDITTQVERLLKTSNYQEARLLVTEAIKKSPDISSHYILLSRCYREEGRYSNALQVIARAYSFFPHNPWVAKEFADVSRSMGMYSRALSLYREGINEVEPSYRHLWYYGMGVCYLELGESHKAIHFLEQAIRGKLAFWSLYYLGRAYRAQNLLHRAIWAFERSELQLFGQPAWATNLLYYEWGTTLVELGIAIKTTNTEAARTLFSSLVQDSRFTDRRVRERAEFWLKRL